MMLGPKPSDEWFVSDRGRVSGPFTVERLRDLLRWGRLSKDALLCDAYQSAWLSLRQSPLAAAAREEAEAGAAGAGPTATHAPAEPLDPDPAPVAFLALGAVVALVFAVLAP